MRQALRGFRRLVLAIDGFLVAVAMFLAYGLHSALRPHLAFLKQPPSLDTYVMLGYVALPLWLVLVVLLRQHRIFEQRVGRAGLFWGLFKLHVIGLIALSVVLFITNVKLNRSLVVLFLGCTFTLMYLLRSVVGMWVRYQYQTGQGRTRMLLAGWPQTVMTWFADVAAQDPHPPELVGYLEPDEGQKSASDLPESSSRRARPSQHLPRCLGHVNDLGRVLHEEAVDQVLFFPPLNDLAAADQALDTCEALGVPAAFVVDLVRRDRVEPEVVSLYDQPFIAFELAPKRPEALALKHGFDVIVAAIGLLLLAPLLVLTALLILVSMGRPVFFLQERVGLFGRRFRMIKLRTMVAGAEAQRDMVADEMNEMDGPVFKASRDPRVTWLGRLLRRTSIDELPQLFNVLRGEMSLVGPRPLPVVEQQQISGAQRRRLSMKPGITGLWQVSGRSNLGFDEWMRLDLEYVDRWSLGLDLWLLLKTIPSVLWGRGAH